MSCKSILRTIAATALVALSGCLVTQSGSLEVLNPKQAYGQSLAVVGDLHRENEAIEKRLASDLQAALTKRGLNVVDDPSKAELVVVPTMGRMRERSPAPAASIEQSTPVEVSEPVVAAPSPEAREFNRFSASTRRSDMSAPRITASARIPATAQQAGLLLTAYRAEDYQDYGIGRQSLPPVWRIYVSQPAMQMKWNSVAVPLINAAASAAKPLGKSLELGAGSAEPEAEREKKKKEPAAEQAEPRKERAKDQKTKRLKDEETAAEKKPET